MTQKIALTVPDISCSHCVAAVQGALQPLPGVRTVDVDLDAKRVTVEYDATQVDVTRMEAVLADEDYPVAAAELVGA